MLLIKPAMHVQ